MAKYFYVDSVIGTRTTGGGTTKQTGSFSGLGASNVYASLAAVIADSAPPTSGDFVLFADEHAETSATSLSFTLAGNGVMLMSVDTANCDTYKKGATITTTGSSNITAVTGSNNQCLYMNGIILVCGTGSGATSISIQSNNLRGSVLKNLTLKIASTNLDSKFLIGGSGSGGGSGASHFIENLTAIFSGTSQELNFGLGDFYLLGGGIDATSSAINGPVFARRDGYSSVRLFVDGFDLSAAATGMVMSTIAASPFFFSIRNSKLPASWSGSLKTGTPVSGSRLELYDCSDGTIIYRLWIEDYCGTITDDTTHYLTGGFSDGTTPLALSFATNGNSLIANGGLVSGWRQVLLTSAASHTVSCELLTDGQLTDQDVGMEVVYLGDATYHNATLSGGIPDPLPSASNLSAGAGTGSWNSTSGITTPTSSKLSTTFTTAESGYALVRIKVYKPNITLYADPKFTVS